MNQKMQELAARAEARCAGRFAEIDRIALCNTEKVLAAFAEERVQAADFCGTTGYGYDDTGRDKLERIYARVLGGERALVRTAFVNGTHAIACAMFACVRPGQTLLSITGGEAVVRVAMKTGKKVIAAGPGNPPVIVDDTADLPDAARRIVDGASFDNNVLCIAEKEVFAFTNIADRLMSEMERCGAVRIYGADIDKVLKTTLINKDGKYVINRKYVGHDAAVILRDSGVSFTGNPRLIIAETDRNHPFVMTEMLMPVLPIVRVSNIDEAVEEAFRAEQGCKHSAMIHSTNVHNMSKAARKLNTTIFVKNSSSFSGLGFDGEGYTTMTIATPTGEGVTSARSFTRLRRCVLYGDFRIC